MPPPLRNLAVAALSVLALGSHALAADADLPSEPGGGEWLEDTLSDGAQWFASSENLAFDAVAAELRDYPGGRRWVRAVDGTPAWMLYYVPRDILGFEIDTHHFGAAGIGFRFAAGPDWNSLTAVDVDFEEIAGFEAKWLRLYRSVEQLPPGTRFLRIEFPQDPEYDAARVSELWLRCRFEDQVAPATTGQESAAVAASVAPSALPEPSDTAIEAYVVTTLTYQPPPLAGPVAPPVAVEATSPALAIDLPVPAATYQLFADLFPGAEPTVADPAAESPYLLSRIVDFVRHRVLR